MLWQSHIKKIRPPQLTTKDGFNLISIFINVKKWFSPHNASIIVLGNILCRRLTICFFLYFCACDICTLDFIFSTEWLFPHSFSYFMRWFKLILLVFTVGLFFCFCYTLVLFVVWFSPDSFFTLEKFYYMITTSNKLRKTAKQPKGWKESMFSISWE